MREEDGILTLVVSLPPSVMSMANVDLEICADRVQLEVDGKPFLHLALPQKVDEEQAKAKFVRKSHELRVTCPVMN